MSQRSLSKIIIRNTFFNVAGRLWGIGVSLFFTPYVLSRLGPERFGVWAIAGVVTSYVCLLDFGIGASFVKYIAEFYAGGDIRKINQLINSGVIFYSFLAVVIVIVTVVSRSFLLAFLRIPPYLYAEAEFVFLLAVLLLAVSNALSPIAALQAGLQRMDISNKISIGSSIPYAMGVVFFLENGYGLRGLMINNVIIFMLNSLLNTVAAFRIFPQLRFGPFLFSMEVFRKLFLFGSKLQVARVSSLISTHMDKLIVNRWVSLSQVVFYQLGFSVIETLKSVALLLPSAVMPAFSEMDARKESERLVEGYVRSSRYLVLAVVPLFALSFVCAPELIVIWIGNGYENAAVIVQILSVGWGLAVVSSMRSAMAQAIGRPGIEMRAGLVAAVLNIPLSIILTVKFGLFGAAMGTTVSLIMSVIYGYWGLHKEIRLDFWAFAKENIVPVFFLCIGAAIAVEIITRLFYVIITDCGRITAVFILIIQTAVFFAVYFIGLTFIKPLCKGDILVLCGGRRFFLRRLLIDFSR